VESGGICWSPAEPTGVMPDWSGNSTGLQWSPVHWFGWLTMSFGWDCTPVESGGIRWNTGWSDKSSKLRHLVSELLSKSRTEILALLYDKSITQIGELALPVLPSKDQIQDLAKQTRDLASPGGPDSATRRRSSASWLECSMRLLWCRSPRLSNLRDLYRRTSNCRCRVCENGRSPNGGM
jgi:hypothetical protein